MVGFDVLRGLEGCQCIDARPLAGCHPSAAGSAPIPPLGDRQGRLASFPSPPPPPHVVGRAVVSSEVTSISQEEQDAENREGMLGASPFNFASLPFRSEASYHPTDSGLHAQGQRSSPHRTRLFGLSRPHSP